MAPKIPSLGDPRVPGPEGPAVLPAVGGARGPVAADWSLLHATGDLTIATAPELDPAPPAAVTDQHPERQLILDLAGATFQDCTGQRVRAKRRLADRFRLRNPPVGAGNPASAMRPARIRGAGRRGDHAGRPWPSGPLARTGAVAAVRPGPGHGGVGGC